MLTLKKIDVGPILIDVPVADPQISSDGDKVLFVYITTDMENDKYNSHIWIIPTKGGNPKQLTYCYGNDTYPRWSIDNKKILFLSNRDTGHNHEGKRKNSLWCLPENGEATLVAELKNDIRQFHLSPDGKKILFLSRIEEESESREEGNEKNDVLWVTKLRYKMNGEPFFPYTRLHLFVLDTESGKLHQLTKGPFDVSSADWSPDGNEVSFVANIEESDNSRIKNIYVVPCVGGIPRKITKDNQVITSVSWSPNSQMMAYTGFNLDGPDYIYKNNNIWILSTYDGKSINLTESFDATIRSTFFGPKWSHDSKKLYFLAPDKGCNHLFDVDVDTRFVELITNDKMTVSSYSMSKDNLKIAFSSTETLWPHEVWLYEKQIKRITSLHEEVMKNWRLTKPDEFWFKASDGIDVQGWVLKPLNYQFGQKYPMILEIHGGPHSLYGYQFTPAEHEFQLLAASGYIVAYLNPRDSIGYGEKFAGIAEGDWGERDYRDIIEAVDYLIEKYDFVDRNKLGVAGGSFGGFMTNWIISHTNMFKAAVTMRSVCNWSSQVAISDMSWGDYGVGKGEYPWDNLEQYRRKSPISFIKNIETPLLILHSENDLRCPMEEAEQLFFALKKNKKDVEFVRFPNESHDLSRTGKPSHRVERLRHILRWFDKYLK
jgi:acylaminoacyl-peptidase